MLVRRGGTEGVQYLPNNLRIKNTLTGQESDLPVKGLLGAIGGYQTSMYDSGLPTFDRFAGHEPETALVRDHDADGYIITVPGTIRTSVRGVFAAGDVQDKRYRLVITCAGSGPH